MEKDTTRPIRRHDKDKRSTVLGRSTTIVIHSHHDATDNASVHSHGIGMGLCAYLDDNTSNKNSQDKNKTTSNNIIIVVVVVVVNKSNGVDETTDLERSKSSNATRQWIVVMAIK